MWPCLLNFLNITALIFSNIEKINKSTQHPSVLPSKQWAASKVVTLHAMAASSGSKFATQLVWAKTILPLTAQYGCWLTVRDKPDRSFVSKLSAFVLDGQSRLDLCKTGLMREDWPNCQAKMEMIGWGLECEGGQMLILMTTVVRMLSVIMSLSRSCTISWS